jgi:hypothetical protein
MKNLKFLYILSAALLISTSCEQELIELEPPPVVATSCNNRYFRNCQFH